MKRGPVLIAFVLVFVVLILHPTAEAKSISSKGGSKSKSSSKGGYGSSSKSSSSSNVGYNNNYNSQPAKPAKSKSFAKSAVKTATKVATAVVAYKVMKKGMKYSSFGRRGGFFPKPYRRRSMFIPIFVPVGRYRSRQYYDRDYGERLRCYACEGRDRDMCAKNPASGAARDYCPPNHYCAVIRREYPTLANGSDYELVGVTGNMSPEQCSSRATELIPAGVDPDYWDNFMSGSTGCKFRHNLSNAVLIDRVCRSVDTLDEGLIGLAGNNSLAKVYTTYCTTEMCNSGDGRLRCYACEGSGVDHPCMVEPGNVSSIVMCEPNEFCHILRTVTMLNSTENDGSLTIEMNITRGCKQYSDSDEDFEVSDGEDLLAGVATLACASDLCNSIDGHLLSASIQEVNGADPGISYSLMSVGIITFFTILLT